VNKLIEKYLIENKVSQSQLARDMGVNQSTVYGWLHKSWNVPSSKLAKLAKIMGCTVEELVKELTVDK
jgi:transcriptional regulator with XRE-family HTH domain